MLFGRLYTPRSRRHAGVAAPAAQVEILESRALLSAEESDPESFRRNELPAVPQAALADVTAIKVATGFNLPVFATFAPGERDNLYVLELTTGQIRVVDLLTNTVRPTPFATVTGISTGGERGLLGLAFAPDYQTSGLFYVNYTNADSVVQIDRFRRDASNPTVADPASRTTILKTTGVQTNHFGGWIGFGPDGLLYVGIGDGGSSNDVGTGHNPEIGNAQDITDNLLGKILRLDVRSDAFPADPDRSYAIPASNPFVGVDGDDEIWAYGLRNPFRNGFDRATGDLVIGDVGQGAREEIDFVPSGASGLNFGWAAREGTLATPNSPLGGPKPAGAIDPVYEYLHGSGTNQGSSVTGGYVYRGPVAGLDGRYFFGDFINARLWSINIANAANPAAYNATNFTDFIDWTTPFNPPGEAVRQIASFGEDLAGNLYFFDLGKGNLFRVTGPVSSRPMFRTFNPNANFHFFTSAQAEFQAVVARGYRDEASAPAFSVLERVDIGATAVHRLYNPVLGTHYLTLNSAERDFLVGRGLTYERDEGFLYATARPGTVEVFRLYNRDSGTHLFTSSTGERDAILAAFPGIWELHTSLGFAPATTSSAASVLAAATSGAVSMAATASTTPVSASATATAALEGDDAQALTDTRIGPVAHIRPTDSDPATINPVTDFGTALPPRANSRPATAAISAPPSTLATDLEVLDNAFRALPHVWEQPV